MKDSHMFKIGYLSITMFTFYLWSLLGLRPLDMRAQHLSSHRPPMSPWVIDKKKRKKANTVNIIKRVFPYERVV